MQAHMLPEAPVWSALQLAIFEDAAHGVGHTVVRARAGTGKTTVICGALRHVPQGLSVLVVAFNVKIRDALLAKQKEGELPAHVTIKTCHGFGFSACASAFRSRLNEWRTRDIIEDQQGDEEEGREYREALKKAVGFAKGSLASTEDDVSSMLGHMLDIGQIDDVWSEHDDEASEVSGLDVFVCNVLSVLRECCENPKAIDFDDMCWLPIVRELPLRQYDRVFVDETQDLNAAQIRLVLGACKPDGRVCAVGDDRQAIYGFRGADASALDTVVEALGAKVLPLSITYRCAASIVAVARKYVPDYRAHEEAEAGEVRPISVATLREMARPGDFVISRKNAPLMGLCLGFLRAGVPAVVAGRDVGKGLRALVDKSKARDMPALIAWLDTWKAAEIRKLSKRKNSERAVGVVMDKAACIVALTKGIGSIGELRSRLDSLFEDRDDAARIVCTTVHKAKGLERRRAFVLTDTFNFGGGEEEQNLFYVAVTRAQSSLFLAHE